jgi:hypothetical protein
MLRTIIEMQFADASVAPRTADQPRVGQVSKVIPQISVVIPSCLRV